MIRRRDEDEDAMMMTMMMMTMGTNGSGSSSSAFSNASRARHPSSTTVPTHHRAHAREFGLEELFARVSLPATLAARSMGVSETTFKLRCDARGEKAHEGSRGVTTDRSSAPWISMTTVLTDRDSSRGGGWWAEILYVFFRSFFSVARARAGSRPVACLSR